MELNKELLAKAKEAKTPEELLALAKENGMELTEESAKAYAEIHRPRRHRAQRSRRSASVSLSEKMPSCGPRTIFSRTHSVFSRKTARSKSV